MIQMDKNSKNKGKMVFGSIVGSLYIIFGVLQIVVWFGLETEISEVLFIAPDIFGGFVLIVIGAVFLYGFKELNVGINEGVAFVYFGILLSLVFAVVYLLIMGADALGAYALGMEDFEGWTPLDDVKPGLYLGILSLLGYLVWRDKFTLKVLSRAGT